MGPRVWGIPVPQVTAILIFAVIQSLPCSCFYHPSTRDFLGTVCPFVPPTKPRSICDLLLAIVLATHTYCREAAARPFSCVNKRPRDTRLPATQRSAKPRWRGAKETSSIPILLVSKILAFCRSCISHPHIFDSSEWLSVPPFHTDLRRYLWSTVRGLHITLVPYSVCLCASSWSLSPPLHLGRDRGHSESSLSLFTCVLAVSGPLYF